MKTSLLFSFVLLLSTVVFSQHIITTRNLFMVNKPIQGNIIGYKTHFSQVTQNKLTFISATDTVEFSINGSSTDDNNLQYLVPAHFY